MEMRASVILVYFLLLVLTTMVHGKGIRCVRCESSNNERCGEDLTKEYKNNATVECDELNQDICMKTKVRAWRTSWTSKNGKSEVATIKVSRFCGKSTDFPWKGCYHKNGKAGDSWTCACKEDKCNSSTTTSASVVAVTVGYFLFKLLL